jgi:serine/threonine protein kinase
VKWIENWTLTPNEVLIDIASYRSPERLQGSAETVESAVYAVGILLFEILGGFRPYSGTNADEILTQHESSDIPPVSAVVSAGCPPEIDDLIMRCTARNPLNRLKNLDELLELIEQARRDIVIGGNSTGPLGDQQTPTTAPHAGTQPRKRRQGNRTLGRVLISMLVLGGLGAGGWYYVANQPAQSAGLFSEMQLSMPSVSLPSWITGLFSGSENDAQYLLVSGDTPLELHGEPASNGTVVGSIPAGSRVEWVDGPQSADGTAWLKIRYTVDTTIVEGWAPQRSLTTTP